MESLGKLFGGILLIAMGLIAIYQNYYNNISTTSMNFFIIMGLILVITGLFLFLVAIFQNFNNKKPERNIRAMSSKNNSGLKSKNTNKKIRSINTKKRKKEKIIEDKNNFSKHDSKVENSKNFLKVPELNQIDDNLTFTPHYEKPVKITRRPIKKSDLVDLNNIPNISKFSKKNKSKEIYKALSIDEDNKSKSSSNSSSDLNIEINTSKEFHEEIGSIKNKKFSTSETTNFKGTGQISKPLKSYVINKRGYITSQKAFNDLAKSAKNEILLEVVSIKNLGSNFISEISALNVKILIQNFDIKDMSYVLLISSLIEQGAIIRTMPLINTMNLIVDNKKALIISENRGEYDLEVGAIFTEKKDILEIKDIFEKSWKLADNIDLNTLM